jgi:predicted nucleic acid-binding protein
MPKPTMTIINTSPLLYLHQVNHLEILHNLYGNVITPEAVIQEISVGQTQGINVPDF